MTKNILPNQSRQPLATPLAMSTAASEPTASPIPVRPQSEQKPLDSSKQEDRKEEKESSSSRPLPPLPSPKLRFEVRDLEHPGAQIFFKNADPIQLIKDSIATVLGTLYVPIKGAERDVESAAAPVRSITLVLRNMDGVAYTTGLELDHEHKEIHFSLNYIAQIQNSKEHPHRQRDEIRGVMFHEMVHVWQWNARGSCPGGLIEGIADFVRLKAELGPPHWHKEAGGDWDAGYQHTAYFLEWLEQKKGKGTVQTINRELRHKVYDEEKFWQGLFGETVDGLFKKYEKTLKE